MAANGLVSALRRKWKHHIFHMSVVALVMLLPSLTQGTGTLLSSSQLQRNEPNDVRVQISESITLDHKTTKNERIISTNVISNSSYLKEDITTTQRLEKESKKTKRSTDRDSGMSSDEYYVKINPTKAQRSEEERIAATEPVQGEGRGVSTNLSGPQKKNYNSLMKKKRFVASEKNRKNSNLIEQNLSAIAKVSVNDQDIVNYRESRDENRKASPDIQDIITGIVKILNGNQQNQADGRPGRPSNTRINNRGPPRISDVPPLDFDNPPAFVPLPSTNNNRVPAPYPFDVPPPITPNVPLPPQPIKPGSKLPTHPFIDGVPLPEAIVPADNYDTISMSETGPNRVPILLTNATGNNQTNVKFSSMNNVMITPTNTTHNMTKPELNKNKVGPKPIIKHPMKRPRPRPTVRPRPAMNSTRITMKPIRHDSVTTPPEKTRNKTEIITHGPSKPVLVPITNQSISFNASDETVQKNQTEFTTLIQSVITDIISSATVPTEAAKPVKPPKFGKPAKNVTDEIGVTMPNLQEPSLVGIGEATPVLESSIPEISPSSETVKQTTYLSSTSTSILSTSTETKSQYKARPGIVLDDPEFKPGKRPVITSRPIITAPPPHQQQHYGEIFDVTVHAVQGPGGEPSSGKPYIYPVELEGVQVQNVNNNGDVITKPQEGQNFVSIDGKRTYINLFGETTTGKVTPTATQPPIIGTGFAVPHKDAPVHQGTGTRPSGSTLPPRRPYKKPHQPPVRIDTCIVGDDSTCDAAQNEMCRTEEGVSSCHCRPGYNRRKHRDPCRRVVSMVTSLRVDRLYDRKLKWQDNLQDPDSEDYQQLSYEASQAIESAMSMTPFSDDFINSRINSIYAAKNLETNEPAVYINMTIQLEENLDTLRPAVKHDIQRHLIRVIQRRNNNVGNSAVWVDSPPGSVLALQDIDECSSAELHDCHEHAFCSNTFGSFKCQCSDGFRDPWIGNIHRQGRNCETCPSEYCNNRGECKYEHGQQVCHCSGSFYGAQCEVDGEVLGVAIGASVAAAIIIILTLVCLCMWSRRWSREQKSAVGAGMGSPVFGFMATGPTVKTPSIGGPPYQVSLEDRIRWAQIADVMAQANHYAQPEPGNGPNRTSFSAYPTLPGHTLSVTGTLPLPTIAPPVPLPRLTLSSKGPLSTYAHSQHGSIHQSTHGMRTSLDTTSSSEEEDRADLLGRNFNAPRPKSRASVANQSGIYYDVDFERSEMYAKQNSIPLSTYTLNPQHQVRPYFR